MSGLEGRIPCQRHAALPMGDLASRQSRDPRCRGGLGEADWDLDLLFGVRSGGCACIVRCCGGDINVWI